jgi:hypothetical protein
MKEPLKPYGKATNRLKLGCPGVWLFGAALLPCGGWPLIGCLVGLAPALRCAVARWTRRPGAYDGPDVHPRRPARLR